MATPSSFPAFLKIESDTQAGFAQFNSEVNRATNNAKRQFEASFSEIEKVIARGISQPLKSTGTIDLGISQYKQAAAQAKLYQQAISDTLRTAQALAVETNDTSKATTRYIQALSAQNIEARSAVAQADAQVSSYSRLQSAIDATASRNSRLAESYRNLFAEQAKAARVEVSQNSRQQGLNEVFAPGLTRSASSNGATTSALTELAKAQDMAAAASARHNQYLEATFMGIERVSKSAQESASVFMKFAAEEEQAAAAAAKLRGQLDPMIGVQKRFDQELKLADDLLKRGSLSTREYAAAVQMARDNLRSGAQAVVENSSNLTQLEKAQRDGTTATRMATGSLGAQRFAMIQVGQQLQDMTVGFASGQRTATIFAQQLPQLGFALTGFRDSTNKSLASLGKLGEVLAGPVGFLVFAGVTAAVYALSAAFSDSDEKTKNKTKSTLTLAEALEKERYGTAEAMKAIYEYNDAQEKSVTMTEAGIKSSIEATKANIAEAISIREKLAARLADAAEQKATSGGSPEAAALAQSISVSIASSKVAENAATITALNATLSNLMGKLGEKMSANLDPLAKINDKYDQMENSAKRAARGNEKLTASLAANIVQINKNRNAALEAQKAQDKASRATRGDTGSKEMTRFGLPFSAGSISSGYGRRSAPTAGASSNHLGVDFRQAAGTLVKATADGIVSFARKNGGYGNQIELDHGAGTKSRYAHLSKFDVSEGQRVSKGDTIGRVGRTGTATGNHLHYEILVNGKKVDPTKGLFATDGVAVTKAADAAAEKAAREAEQLATFGERAAEQVQRINERFNEQPRLVDQAARATRDLEQIINEVGEAKPPNFEQIIKDAETAKTVVEEGLLRPFNDIVKANQRGVEIQQLLLQGREDEVTALQDIYRLQDQVGFVTAEQRATIMENVRMERELNDLLEKRREIISIYQQGIGDVRGMLEDLLSGNSTGNIFKNFAKSIQNVQGKLLTEKLFGDTFRELDDFVNGRTSVKGSIEFLEQQTNYAGESINELATSAVEAANILRSIPVGGSIAANDNVSPVNTAGEIVVTGSNAAAGLNKGNPNSITNVSMDDYVNRLSGGIVGPLLAGMDSIFGVQFFSQFQTILSGALSGYATGGAAGGILGAGQGSARMLGDNGILGKGAAESISKTLGSAMKGAQTGTMVSGIGNALGVKNSKTGAQIGGAIGSAIPIPGGDIIGSIIGGLVGGLFKKTKYGTANVTGVDQFSVSGNNGGAKDAARGGAGSIGAALTKVADQLGATVGAFNVSIGTYKGDYRVSTRGYTGKLKGNTKSEATNERVQGLYNFGKDGEAEAIAFAIKDAINDGAISGIRASTQRLLQTGKDLELGLQNALDFESVFTRLKAYKDPMGSALDVVDKEFKRLKKLFGEAGATAQEYADLEELYGIERAQAVKEAAKRITGSLKDLLKDLTINNDARSIRSRVAGAKAEFDPLAARVAAGDITAYDDFAASARTYLDLQREISGSQQTYFDLLEHITSLTAKAVSDQENIISIAEGRDSPFSNVPTPSNDNQTVVDSLGLLGTNLLNGLVPQFDLIVQAIRQNAIGGGSGFNYNNIGLVNNF